jgi:CRISPR-associated protein Csx3
MFGDVLIDPVLPKKLNGLTFAIKENNKNVVYKYHISKNTFAPYRITINGKEAQNLRRAENPYRAGGALIAGNTFDAMLNKTENSVEIFM